jgi:hypothetical protein
MGFTLTSKGYNDQSTLSSLRLILYKDEVCRLPQGCQEIRVLSGRAWVTVSEKDLFLCSGDSLALNPKRTLALASALGNAPLVLEVRGQQEIGVGGPLAV